MREKIKAAIERSRGPGSSQAKLAQLRVTLRYLLANPPLDTGKLAAEIDSLSGLCGVDDDGCPIPGPTRIERIKALLDGQPLAGSVPEMLRKRIEELDQFLSDSEAHPTSRVAFKMLLAELEPLAAADKAAREGNDEQR